MWLINKLEAEYRKRQAGSIESRGMTLNETLIGPIVANSPDLSCLPS